MGGGVDARDPLGAAPSQVSSSGRLDHCARSRAAGARGSAAAPRAPPRAPSRAPATRSAPARRAPPRRPAAAVAAEVRAQPRAQVAGAADVQHLLVAVAEEVDARPRRRTGGERALAVQPPCARRGRARRGPRPSGPRAPARARSARSSASAVASRVGQGAVARPRRRAEELREGREPDARVRPSSSRRASQTVSTTGAATRRPVSRSTSRSRNAEVEARVVRHQHRVAGEAEEAPHGELGRGRAAQRLRLDAGQRRDRRRSGTPWIDERLEPRPPSSSPQTRTAPISQIRATARPQTGRLEVDDDVRRVLERELRAGRIGERRPQPPRQASRASPVDDVRRAARARSRPAAAGARTGAAPPPRPPPARAAPRRARRGDRRHRTRAARREPSEHTFACKSREERAARDVPRRGGS